MLWGLEVETANSPGAGTNADTHVIVYGELGQSPEPGYEFVLDNDGDDMEQGDTDLYILELGAIGIPNAIHLWFNPDGDSDSPDWHCVSMRLFTRDDTIVVRFPINQVFSKKGWYYISSEKLKNSRFSELTPMKQIKVSSEVPSVDS
jgi:hypothetical protein